MRLLLKTKDGLRMKVLAQASAFALGFFALTEEDYPAVATSRQADHGGSIKEGRRPMGNSIRKAGHGRPFIRACQVREPVPYTHTLSGSIRTGPLRAQSYHAQLHDFKPIADVSTAVAPGLASAAFVAPR